MKKLSICLMLLLLTGCQNVYDVEHREQMKHQIAIQSDIESMVTYEEGEWTGLNEELDTLADEKAWGHARWNTAEDYSQWQGVALNEGMLSIENIESIEGQKAVAVIESHIGEEFTAFLNGLGEMEPWEVKEAVIGNYGVVVENWSYGEDAESVKNLYVIGSSLKFANEALQQWADELKGENMLVTAISAGEEEKLVEFSYPSTIAERKASLGGSKLTAYYQVYLNQQNEVKKVKLIFRQRGNKVNLLSEDKINEVEHFISSISKDEVNVSSLTQDIDRMLSGNLKKKKGTVGSFDYDITNYNQDSGYSKLVLVELNPS